MDRISEDQGDAVVRARDELNASQRARFWPVELVGDTVVAIGVPYLLWNDVDHVLLIAWGALVVLTVLLMETSVGFRARRQPSMPALMTAFEWTNTVAWGALPWIAFDALDLAGVQWVLVAVVVFGIAGDTIFANQSSETYVDEMVVAFTASYLLAFSLHGAWGPIVGVVTAGGTLLIGGVGIAKLTVELIDQRAESERRALIDELTGVGNRRAATDAVNRLIDDGATHIHCAFFDLDDFKQLNDNYGYDIGDAALCEVSELLTRFLPVGWSLARFGGDEFVAVGATPIQLTEALTMNLTLEGQGDLVLSQPLSIGMSSLPATDTTADTIFHEGAAALRVAKRLGKHQLVRMTDEIRTAENTRVGLAARVEKALEQREIVPWAQPIVELSTRRTVGLELLARWPQSDGTMVMPNDFVPVIEDQGRGPALGLLMIDHAIAALTRPALRDRPFFISVNLSARHLFHRRLPTEIDTRLRAAGVPAEGLVAEITESQYLPSSPVWEETAQGIRDLGVGLAIDDFGTGYSSMEQLLSMPFSHLKVDRVMTQSLARRGAKELVTGVAAMAAGSGLEAIAEGIETEDECQTMLQAGFSLGQGYLFARPAPLDTVLETIGDEPMPAAGEVRQVTGIPGG